MRLYIVGGGRQRVMFRRSGSLHFGELSTNSDYGAGVFAHRRNALTLAPSLRRLLSHSPFSRMPSFTKITRCLPPSFCSHAW